MSRRIGLVSVALFLLFAAPAVAQNGVTYDEDSPAGTEYVIPLDAARNVGGSDGPAPSGGPAPATTESSPDASAEDPRFGAGVEPERTRSQNGAKQSEDESTGGAIGSSGDGTGGSGTSIRTIAADAGSSQLQLGLLVAALAAAAGAAGGLVARRSRGGLG